MKGHVLVVEDDEAIRESLVEILNEHGYAAGAAPNGREALDHLLRAEEKPCLILLDLMMPVMDGREFRDQQLQHPDLAPIPVCIISAYHDAGDIAGSMGATTHLPKPLKVNAVIEVVNRYCECDTRSVT